jgi:cytidylate kinase
MKTRLLERDRDTAKLIEKQMRNWEIARAQRPEASGRKRPAVQPFVAISRSVGAGGGEVATQVSRRLGWPLFDRELLTVMARDDERRELIYASMDERDLGWLEETVRAVGQPEFRKNDYFHRLTSTVLALAVQGRCIFVGRGADLILPRDCGLRVRIVAPRDDCVRRFARRSQISFQEAERQTARIERERGEFVRTHFGVDAADPTRCDLTVSLERFSPADAAELIVDALARRGIEASTPAPTLSLQGRGSRSTASERE